jgi:hypothetical protein
VLAAGEDEHGSGTHILDAIRDDWRRPWEGSLDRGPHHDQTLRGTGGVRTRAQQADDGEGHCTSQLGMRLLHRGLLQEGLT